MALSIKHPEADKLARRLAEVTGEGLTQAVLTALRERLDRVEQHHDRGLAQRLLAIGKAAASLPIVDNRTPDEIIGYGADGLPHEMVIDTSAVIAILEDEDDAHTFAYAIAAASIRRMSAPNLFECSLVALRRGEANLALLDSIVRNAAVEVVAFAPADLEFARDAYRRFGRGRHAAALNFGDCFAYGLAKRLEEPLLFKGDEFTRTDVCSALA